MSMLNECVVSIACLFFIQMLRIVGPGIVWDLNPYYLCTQRIKEE